MRCVKQGLGGVGRHKLGFVRTFARLMCEAHGEPKVSCMLYLEMVWRRGGRRGVATGAPSNLYLSLERYRACSHFVKALCDIIRGTLLLYYFDNSWYWIGVYFNNSIKTMNNAQRSTPSEVNFVIRQDLIIHENYSALYREARIWHLHSAITCIDKHQSGVV